MIYIHVPFCRSFCTYCDFYSEICCREKEEQDFEHYTKALVEEIESRRNEIQASSGTDTLYIGGGTPSVLPLSCLEEISAALGKSDFKEFTMEANPEDIIQKGASYVKGLSSLGVNRISLGIQSLDDDILHWMNRRHNAQRALEAMDMVREGGIENLSVDVIFGLDNLSDKSLQDTLNRILDKKPEHISAYQLSIEEGSALAKMISEGKYREADDEKCLRQYSEICSRLSSAGYSHYEISNWALPGYEAVHNSAYWTREPYVGLGPGAHSFFIAENGREKRSWNSRNISEWTSESELLDDEDIIAEKIMLGLRTSKGIDPQLCDRKALKRTLEENCLVREGDKVRIPEEKFFVSDDIISDLLP